MGTIFDNKLKTIGDMIKDDYCLGFQIEDEFLWEDVMACMDYTAPVFFGHFSCPICGRPSEQLRWIRFVSPEKTWHDFAGIGGLLSICTNCHIQVEYIGLIRN